MPKECSYSVRKLDKRKKLPTSSFNYRAKLIRCGKEGCKGCPHGPYWYRNSWNGNRKVWEYIGRITPAELGPEAEAEMLAQVELRAEKKGGK